MGLSDRQTDACVAQVELLCGGKWTQISDLGWMHFFDFRDKNRGSLPLFDGIVLFSVLDTGKTTKIGDFTLQTYRDGYSYPSHRWFSGLRRFRSSNFVRNLLHSPYQSFRDILQVLFIFSLLPSNCGRASCQMLRS